MQADSGGVTHMLIAYPKCVLQIVINMIIMRTRWALSQEQRVHTAYALN